MDGEVKDCLEEAITKPLPVIKAGSALGKFWPDMLLPLCVLYSPLLRLRFHSAFAICCNDINVACRRIIFQDPQGASKKLAFEIEGLGVEPPLGTIYVQDSEGRKATEGSVQLFQDRVGALVSAIVSLPESETDPYSTLGVTMEQVCSLLGVSNVGHVLTEEASNELKKAYNSNL
jgi:hypothetical protein